MGADYSKMILARGLLAELPETVLVRRRPEPVGRRLRCAFEGPFISEGWRLVHLHGEPIQRRVLFRDALMKILALKVSELRRQQPAIALDIPLMAQDFLGSISIIVVAASSAKVTIPFG